MDASTLAGVGVRVPVGRWLIDPDSSTASFSVRNFGVHMVRGIVPIREATAVVAEGHRVTAVHAVLNLAAIDTANTKRDKDLRARGLLDTERFPDLVFDATNIQATTDGWLLKGALTAHGASIPVTMHCVLATGPTNGGMTIQATTRLDRRDLGIRAPRMLIGHHVLVEIDARFRIG